MKFLIKVDTKKNIDGLLANMDNSGSGKYNL